MSIRRITALLLLLAISSLVIISCQQAGEEAPEVKSSPDAIANPAKQNPRAIVAEQDRLISANSSDKATSVVDIYRRNKKRLVAISVICFPDSPGAPYLPRLSILRRQGQLWIDDNPGTALFFQTPGELAAVIPSKTERQKIVNRAQRLADKLPGTCFPDKP